MTHIVLKSYRDRMDTNAVSENILQKEKKY